MKDGHRSAFDVLQVVRQAPPPESILALSRDVLSDAERLLVYSLQGLAVRSPVGIYVIAGDASALWLAQIEQTGVPVKRLDSLAALLTELRGQVAVAGYIRTRLGSPALNAATNLASLHRAVLLDERLAGLADRQGWHELADAEGLDDVAAWRLGKGAYARHVAFQQSPAKLDLRDAVIASGGYVFYDPPEALLNAVSKHVAPGAPVLGWGHGAERLHVGRLTEHGLRSIPADWSLNLSVLGRFTTERLEQTRRAASIDLEDDVHCVAFVMSDGDNIQWLAGENFALDARYFGNPARGRFPMGWQMSPGLIDAAPHVLHWLYTQAINDEYVMGVSGAGYFFPSLSPNLPAHAERLAAAIARTDMPIVTILDDAPLRSHEFRSVAEHYARAAGFAGGIYLNYDDYAGGRGDAVWVDDIPFISARLKLWDGDPMEMAARINALPRDPRAIDGYTIVSVHPWSHTLDDVDKVVENLGDHVRVVLPSELFARVRAFAAR